MEHAARFSFHGDLEELLVSRYRVRPIAYRFRDSPGVKDPIEAMGVPHTEVDVILANGLSVGFDYRLRDGDDVDVYPVRAAPPVRPLVPLSPPPPQPAIFALDVHLGKLARRLRLLGFDCFYRNDCGDDELISLALEQGRILLTRDLGILRQRRVVHGHLVRSGAVDAQVAAVLERYRLRDAIRPWLRCMVCNGLTRPVAKEDVLHRLEPKTRRYYDTFQRCEDCGQIYWQGPHHVRIKAWLDRFGWQGEGGVDE